MSNYVSHYVKAQVKEVQENWVLPFYGAALALTHLWTFLYWNRGSFFVTSQSPLNAEPLCFPFFPDCDLFRSSLSSQTWEIILYSYLGLTLVTILSFGWPRKQGLSMGLLLILTLMKFALHMSNYNFMGNYHYMIYFVTFSFLFLPHKTSSIKHLMVAFYVAAGFLKVNMDWLSGAAMIQSPFISGNLLTLSLFYVLFLELIFSFGLLHKNPWIRRGVLVQYGLFHAFSWHIVGFFYPLVMFCLLSIFGLEEFSLIKKGYTQKEKKTSNELLELFRLKAPKPVLALLAAFIILQLIPLLWVKDPSLSGAPRLPSLNMFDSKTQCHSLLVLHTDQGVVHLKKPLKRLGVRLKCDPLVYLNRGYQLCRKNKKFKDIKKISLTLFSKRVTQTHYKKVLDIKDLCPLKNPLWAELWEGDPS